MRTKFSLSSVSVVLPYSPLFRMNKLRLIWLAGEGWKKEHEQKEKGWRRKMLLVFSVVRLNHFFFSFSNSKLPFTLITTLNSDSYVQENLSGWFLTLSYNFYLVGAYLWREICRGRYKKGWIQKKKEKTYWMKVKWKKKKERKIIKLRDTDMKPNTSNRDTVMQVAREEWGREWRKQGYFNDAVVEEMEMCADTIIHSAYKSNGMVYPLRRITA